MDPTLSAIHLYPVKGIRGLKVDQAVVEQAGLRHDRRWVIVDEEGKFLSQRTHPRLALITGSFDGETLELAAPGHGDTTVGVAGLDAKIDVTVWRDTVSAAAAGEEADRWLSAFLDHTCHLGFMHESCRRPISSSSGRDGDTVSFADGYPLLLISQASLDDLNSRLDVPLPMDRFRPNLVVSGCTPYAEELWRRISIGDAVFRYAGRCPRCSVTTVDQMTGAKVSEEPLRTLMTYRNTEAGLVFGVNLIPETTGTIRTADPVVIIE